MTGAVRAHALLLERVPRWPWDLARVARLVGDFPEVDPVRVTGRAAEYMTSADRVGRDPHPALRGFFERASDEQAKSEQPPDLAVYDTWTHV